MVFHSLNGLGVGTMGGGSKFNSKIIIILNVMIIWETFCRKAATPPPLTINHDDRLTTSKHPVDPRLVPGNGWPEKTLRPFLFWNVPKLLTCPLAANQGWPNVLEDPWVSLTPLILTLWNGFHWDSVSFLLNEMYSLTPLNPCRVMAEGFSCCKFMNKQVLLILFWT